MTRPLIRMLQLLLALLLAAYPAFSQAAPSLPMPAGKKLAERCMLCHGERGENHLLGIPRIGGRDFYDLLANMSRFRTGGRPHPIMTAIMQTLDEVDMVEVAEYFSQQEPAGVN